MSFTTSYPAIHFVEVEQLCCHLMFRFIMTSFYKVMKILLTQVSHFHYEILTVMKSLKSYRRELVR